MPPQNPHAPPWQMVTIEEVDPDLQMVLVKDKYGKLSKIPLNVMPARGMYPAPGETWMLSMNFGRWNLAAVVRSAPPVVTGSNDAIPALQSLIEALAKGGIVVDQTTADRIRADHPHTHPDPQGGSTGVDVG